MEALLRRSILILTPVCFLGVGCSLFDRDTDRIVKRDLKDGKSQLQKPANDPLAGSTVTRPQAPSVSEFDPIDAPQPPANNSGGPIAPPIIAPQPIKSPPVVVPASPPTVQGAPVVPLAPVVPENAPVRQAPAAGPIQPQAVIQASDTLQPQKIEKLNPENAETRVKVIATVGPDCLITDEDVLIMMRQRARDYLLLTGTEREIKEREVYKEELKRLIERELVINEFLARLKKNKPTLVDEVWEEAARMTDKQIREIRKHSNMKSESEFLDMLQAQGMTMKSFRRQLERAAISSIYTTQYMKEKNRGVSLQQIIDYYKAHPDEFKVEDRVKWQHMFVSVNRFKTPAEAKLYAEWLLKSLAAGGDFAKLAKEYGHGDSALRDGDGSGKKRGEIHPAELESAVFSMEAGQTSGLIPTSAGYHIVRILERDVAGIRPLDTKLQSQIKSQISEMDFKREKEKMIADLWRRTTVSIQE